MIDPTPSDEFDGAVVPGSDVHRRIVFLRTKLEEVTKERDAMRYALQDLHEQQRCACPLRGCPRHQSPAAHHRRKLLGWEEPGSDS